MQEEKLEYLSLGSVVKLKGASETLMIISRAMVLDIENEKKLVDYGACIFPDGVINDKMIYFNHCDIEKVVFTGYVDETEKRMIQNINKAAAKTMIEHADIRGMLKKNNE